MGPWEGGEPASRRRSWPRWWAGAGILGLVLVGAAVAGALNGVEDGSGAIDLDPDSDAPFRPGLGRFDPGPDPVPEDGSGTWAAIAKPDALLDPSATWTGERLLLVADSPDGAVVGQAYDPVADRWEDLPAPPFEADADRTAVWTGQFMVVLHRHADRPEVGVATYDPAVAVWEAGPTAPGEQWKLPTAAWDGQHVVLLGQGDAGAAYDPTTARWSDIGGAAGVGGSVVATAVLHDRIVALVDTGDDSLAITARDPDRDRWTTPATAPGGAPWEAGLVADPGRDRVIVAGPHRRDGSLQMRAATWSPEHGWDDLPGADEAPSRDRPLLSASDHSVVAWWPEAAQGARHRIGATRPWQNMHPAMPVEPGADAVFAGRRLLVFGDAQGDSGAAGWDPLAGGAGDAAPAERAGPALEGRWREELVDPESRERPGLEAVNGTVHVVAGLTRAGPPVDDGLVLHPGAGVTRRIPEGHAPPGFSPLTAWTGQELLVWSGEQGAARPGGSGGAYDPTAGRWRELPPWPHERSGNPVGAWNGSELLVAAGAGALDAAAAYAPRTDQWRELARPPDQGRPIDAAWTGDVLVVLVGVPGGLAVHRYDPGADRWGSGEQAPLTVRGGRPVVAWTGEELLVWGGLGTDGAGAAYDPQANAWRRLPDAPVVAPSTAVGAWTGEHLIVLGIRDDRTVGAVALEPHSDRWLVLPNADRPLQGLGPAVWTGRELLLWNPRGRPHSFTPAG